MYVDPNRNTEAGNLKWILPYCKPDLPRVAGAIVLFCVNNTMALIIPLLSGLIVDRVIVQGQVDELTRLCIMMIVFTIVRVASRYGYQMWMERFGQNSVFRLVSDEYEKLHELDFTYFNHTRTGDIMSRMTSDTDAIRHARPLFFAIRNSLAEMNSMVEENIEGNRVVKAFVREPYETEKFDKHNDDYMQRNMDQAYNSRKYMPWLDGLGFSLQLVTLGFGGFLVITGRMTLGNLVTFNSYLWMIDGPVRQSGWLINDWQRFNASCIKIRKLLTAQSRITEKPENTEKPGDSADANHASTAAATAATTNTTRIAGSIDFQHVSFAFPDEPNTPVLEDVDFHVPAGAKLGILGETGAGKSTLVNLISRFYDPTEGHVLIDGVDARDWPLATLRSQVCVVAQDTFLFSDTIGGNISFGAGEQREYDEQYIRRMATIAGADGFIRSMPEGYDTVVGERGVGLSGGQRQRLSLARALADNPSILIMDDTTSAVDMETEAEIQRHLRELDEQKTIVTIAHRISSVKDSDLILVLEHGRIVERGTHDELVAAHGRYWEIYYRQLGLQAGRSQGFEA